MDEYFAREIVFGLPLDVFPLPHHLLHEAQVGKKLRIAMYYTSNSSHSSCSRFGALSSGRCCSPRYSSPYLSSRLDGMPGSVAQMKNVSSRCTRKTIRERAI